MRTLPNKLLVKLIVEKVASVLPGQAAFDFYEFCVSLAAGKADVRIPSFRIAKGFENVTDLNKYLDFSCLGKTVLELGTGWHGIDPIIFYLCGAKAIYTIDIADHLSTGALMRACILIQQAEIPAKMTDLSRVERFKSLNFSTMNRSDILSELKLTVLIARPEHYAEKISSLGVGVDLLYSESVLHRFSERLLHAVLKSSHGVLVPGAAIFHRIDQKDINSQVHMGLPVPALYHLSLSDFAFNWLYTSKISGQNRYRESEYAAMFEKLPTDIRAIESFIQPGALTAVPVETLNTAFRSYDPDDLCTVASRFFCTNRTSSPAGRVHHRTMQ